MSKLGATLALLGITLATASGAKAVEYRFYHPDPLGSNVLVTDRQGQVVQRTVYKPYGELSSVVDGTGSTLDSSSDRPRHLFTGQEHDPESDLHQLGARYYDPLTGRFLAHDPGLRRAEPGPSFEGIDSDPVNFNAHAYAGNRPTTRVDPTGEFFESATDLASLTLAYAEFDRDPSLLNTAGLIYDAVATAVPVLPAGYGIGVTAVGATRRAGSALRGASRGTGGIARGGTVSRNGRISMGPRERTAFLGLSGQQIPRGPSGSRQVAERLSQTGIRPSRPVGDSKATVMSLDPGSVRRAAMRDDFVLTVKVKGGATNGHLLMTNKPIPPEDLVSLRRVGGSFDSFATGDVEFAFEGPAIRFR